MFGETWVDPTRLFDPTSEAPPSDALDVHFTVPTSMSLFVDALTRTSKMTHLLPRLAEVYGEVLTDACTKLQRSGGYVIHPGAGELTPARLALTVVSENVVAGESIPRIHGHIYVGRFALALRDNTICPLNVTRLRQAVDNVVWGSYLNRLEARTAEEFGLVWGPLPGNHPGDKEVVEPAFASYVAQHRRPDDVICPGRYGPREQILADQQWRIGIAESQVRVQAEHREVG